ncbi:MAG: metalloregulator ArsR/SmtB family transcription factor [Schumannella sp.]
MADIFDVLADGTRREILSRLKGHGGEVSVTELVTELGISQPTVSKHLKVLREAGLVAVREEGQHRFYRLDVARWPSLEEWLARFSAPGAGARMTTRLTRFSTPGRAPRSAIAWAGPRRTPRIRRAALEAAQEKIQGAQKRVSDRVAERFPRWGNDED